MRLIERAPELAALREAFEASAHGRGRTVVVRGNIGSGKTALLREFTSAVQCPVGTSPAWDTTASDSGSRTAFQNDRSRREHCAALCLSASGSPLERAVPLSVVHQIFARAPLPSDDFATAQRLLSEARADKSLSAEGQPVVASALLYELTETLLSLAHQRHLLMTVDDIQYADVASLDCLRRLAERSQDLPLTLVLSESTHVAPVNPALYTEMLRSVQHYRVRLDMLSSSGVRDVLGQHFHAAVADRIAPAIHRATGGNPLLVRSIIDDVQVAGDDTGFVDFTVGDGFHQAVLACLERSAPQTVDVARAAAVLGLSESLGTRSHSLVPRMLGVDEGSVDTAFRVLADMGLIDDGGRFRQSEAACAIREGMPESQSEQLNQRAMQLLHLRGVPAQQLAKHVVAAGQTPSSWEVDVLLEAGENALADDDAEQAIGYFERAEGGLIDESQQPKLSSALARAGWRLNPATATRYLPGLFEEFKQGRLNDHDSSSLLRYLTWHGRIDKAAEAIERSATMDRSRAGYQFEAACQLLVNSYPPLRPVVARARAQVPAPVDRPAGCTAAANALHSALVGHSGNDVLDAVLGMLRLPLTDRNVEAIESALLTLVFQERVDRAAPLCDELLTEADRRKAPTWRAVLAAVRAEIALRKGDARRARRLAEEALAAIPRSSWGVAVGGPLSTLVISTLELGDARAAGAELDSMVPDSVFQSRFGLHYLHARGRYCLATDQFSAALADFEFCGVLMGEWGIDSPSFLPWRSEAAHALIRMNQTQHAEELLVEQGALAGESAHRARGLTSLGLAQVRQGAEGMSLARRAVDELHLAGDRLSLERARAVLARLRPSCGKVRQPHDRHRPAEEHRRPLRAATDVEFGAGRRPGTGQRAGANLTTSELRVAELAAYGNTNREIARYLYVTVSTVEQHLTKIYRKLDIGSRSALPARLCLNGEEDQDGFLVRSRSGLSEAGAPNRDELPRSLNRSRLVERDSAAS